jgi:hypothetical protein
MPNPLRSWNQIPWRSLFQSAALAIFLVKLADVSLGFADRLSTNLPLLSKLFRLISSGSWGMISVVVASFGLGILALVFLETYFRSGPIYSSTLWGLVLCLMLVLVIMDLLFSRLPPGLLRIGLSYETLIGMVVGVSWRGRRYWRY